MSTLSIATTKNNSYGRWDHAFQGKNINWLNFVDKRILSGNFFLGLQGMTIQIFTGMGIPPGAIIESAFMKVTAYRNDLAPYTTFLNTVDRDANLLTRSHINPDTPFTGWRPDVWSNANITILDNALGVMANTSGSIDNAAWIFRQIPATGQSASGSAHSDRMAQRFTVPSGSIAARTVNTVTPKMYRSAVAPAGSMRVQIMGIDADGMPDETVLATSDSVSMSTFITSGAGGNVSFVFTGANLVALNPGDYYVTLVPDQYVANNVNWVAMRHQNQFFTTGLLRHYGTGIATDWQNFPGVTEVFSSHANATTELSTSITWAVPAFVTGVQYTTPDIKQLIQDQIDAPGYGSDQSLIVTTQGNSGTATRIWRANGDPANTPPMLEVTWSPPPPVTSFVEPNLFGLYKTSISLMGVETSAVNVSGVLQTGTDLRGKLESDTKLLGLNRINNPTTGKTQD